MNLVARAARRTFWTQVIFSTIGMAFSVSMLATGRDPSIYLPIFTSILFAWLPSPMHHDDANARDHEQQQRRVLAAIGGYSHGKFYR